MVKWPIFFIYKYFTILSYKYIYGTVTANIHGLSDLDKPVNNLTTMRAYCKIPGGIEVRIKKEGGDPVVIVLRGATDPHPPSSHTKPVSACGLAGPNSRMFMFGIAQNNREKCIGRVRSRKLTVIL